MQHNWEGRLHIAIPISHNSCCIWLAKHSSWLARLRLLFDTTAGFAALESLESARAAATDVLSFAAQLQLRQLELQSARVMAAGTDYQLATALAQATAAGAAAAGRATALQLKSFDCLQHPCAAVLQHLPAATLTNLRVMLRPNFHEGEPRRDCSTALHAIASLHNLRDLYIKTENPFVDDYRVLSCTLTLTQLTSLAVHCHCWGTATVYLPASIEVLEAYMNRWVPDEYNPPDFVVDCAIQLGHLNKCTSLCLTSYDLALDFRDRLPPNLKQLTVADVSDSLGFESGPLRPLTQLEDLTLYNSAASAQYLRQLSRLTALKQIRLEYPQDVSTEHAAAAWPVLPIKCLVLDCSRDEPLPAAAVQHFGKIRGLLELQLEGRIDTTVEQVSAALKQLTNLTQLNIARLELQQSAAPWEEPVEAAHSCTATNVGAAGSARSVVEDTLAAGQFTPLMVAIGSLANPDRPNHPRYACGC